MKFKFDCVNNRFWRISDEYSYEIPEEQTFTDPYGAQGFIFDSAQPNHWISFTACGEEIRIFYKQFSKVNGKELINYYQKDVPREEVIKFELTKADIIMKKDDKWLNKKIRNSKQ